jgi:imidazolonepropionase-like amidohydrolase
LFGKNNSLNDNTNYYELLSSFKVKKIRKYQLIKMKVIKCRKIIPVTNKEISDGYILIDKKGKIKKIEKGDNYPKDAELIDASDLIAFPGIVDAHSHAGLSIEEIGLNMNDTNECSDPITPFVRALDAIDTTDKGFKRAISAGVTCLCITPGSGNIVGGQMTTIKTHGTIIDDIVVTENAGMKCAFGENPKRVYGNQGKMPMTRMGSLGLFRKLMIETMNYMKKWEKYDKELKEYEEELKKYQEKKNKKKKPKKPSKPEKDIKYESMIPIFKKQIPLRAHAHQANDIITAIRLAEEFDVNICIEHCSEGHLIVDYYAKKKVPAIIGPTFGFRSKIETRNKTWQTIIQLYNAGVLVALTSDHPVVPLQYQTIYAAIAHREGLSKQGAYEIITINPAKILGIDDKVGSLEKGKDADIVLFEGDPLNLQSKVQKVLIDGKIIYEAEKCRKELF